MTTGNLLYNQINVRLKEDGDGGALSFWVGGKGGVGVG